MEHVGRCMYIHNKGTQYIVHMHTSTCTMYAAQIATFSAAEIFVSFFVLIHVFSTTDNPKY